MTVSTGIRRIAEEARLSGAVVHGNTVYLAGQVADDATLDIEGQTADILRQIDALLAEAGTSKAYMLNMQIFIANLADFDGMNRAYDSWLDKGNKPGRMTVEAKLANPAWKVEITGTAAIPPVQPASQTQFA